MPIRITCPSCSATLSVKDEFAGRAVKCPKCAGIIPPSQPAAPPAPPPPSEAVSPPPPPAPPAPERSPFEALDEPAKPAKTGSKITGKPAARSRPVDDDDEDDRPRKKRRDDDEDERDEKPRAKPRRDEDEEDRPRKAAATRDRDDEDDRDRPARRRRRDEDDDDDDDRPSRGRRKPQGKSNAPLILGIVGFFLLTCCGGVGYGVYWVVNKAKETAEKIKEELDKANLSVTVDRYDKVKIGDTRAQAEGLLGKGRAATVDDLAKVFRAANDKKRIAEWTPKVTQGRVVIWQNMDEAYVLAAFHPNTDADGRVQAKEWRAKSGDSAGTGELDDAEFLKRYPAKGEDLSGPAVEGTAEEIAQAYKDNKAAADTKYKDKIVLIEGKLDAIDLLPDGVMYARLVGTGSVGRPGNVQPRCVVQAGEMKKVFECSRGQTVKFRGKCAGLSGPFVDVMSAKVESSGPDPSVTATAATFLGDYARNEMMADEKYKEKQVTITNAVVESKTADAVFLIASVKAKTTLKIKVAYAGDFRRQYENLKPGDRVGKIKGECGGMFNNEVFLNRAWIVP